MKGKLIVIEGGDGAGKTTQLKMLADYLMSKKINVETIDFPRYYGSFYGKLLARFLKGEFGTLDQVNPYLLSVIFALDRAQAKKEIESWLSKGIIVLSNRYATSNMAHQAGRVPKGKRKDFVVWDEELEYKVNKLPREEIVIFLHVPYTISQKLMRGNDRANRSYLKGKVKDMVEKNKSYLKNAEETYLWLCKRFPHWVKIECVNSKGELRPKEEIHEEIKKVLIKKSLILGI